MDFANRAYDRSFRIDPIVRSLLDVDFYKASQLQLVWEKFFNVQTEWSLMNRTKSIRLADEIDINELRAQLDHARTLQLTHSELIWLRGQTFYGEEGIFKPGYINALKTLRLPEYHLEKTDDGQFDLRFTGPWWKVSWWEIIALVIINEMLARARLKRYNRSQLDIIYARGKVKLYDKLEKLAELPRLNLTDFGTRRRHSFLWQEHCVLTACEVLGDRFTGTSNMHLAMKHGVEAKGSMAHELSMAFAALSRSKDGDAASLRHSQYDLLQTWQNTYHDNMRMGLPDTFGSTQFFDNAPQWVSNWKGFRPDSKEPIEAGEEIIAFYKKNGLTDDQVKNKIVLFSDGLDVELNGKSNGSDIIRLQKHFEDRIGVGFGFGTNLTNDFIGCAPDDPNALKSISLVCKLTKVNGRSTVKLSDNFEKKMGSKEEVDFYLDTFGTQGMAALPTNV